MHKAICWGSGGKELESTPFLLVLTGYSHPSIKPMSVDSDCTTFLQTCTEPEITPFEKYSSL